MLSCPFLQYSPSLALLGCQVELFFDGVSVAPGAQSNGWANWTQWNADDIANPFRPGNLTAVGYNAAGETVASDTYVTPGEPAKLSLTVDVPSPTTGTGSALVLDGKVRTAMHCTALHARTHARIGSQANSIEHSIAEHNIAEHNRAKFSIP